MLGYRTSGGRTVAGAPLNSLGKGWHLQNLKSMRSFEVVEHVSNTRKHSTSVGNIPGMQDRAASLLEKHGQDVDNDSWPRVFFSPLHSTSLHARRYPTALFSLPFFMTTVLHHVKYMSGYGLLVGYRTTRVGPFFGCCFCSVACFVSAVWHIFLVCFMRGIYQWLWHIILIVFLLCDRLTLPVAILPYWSYWVLRMGCVAKKYHHSTLWGCCSCCVAFPRDRLYTLLKLRRPGTGAT